MSSILFGLGRDLANEVQAGIKAHNDVKEGKEVERREDKWGDPMQPRSVYSLVRGVEEGLGFGKGKKGKTSATEDVKSGQSVVPGAGPPAPTADSRTADSTETPIPSTSPSPPPYHTDNPASSLPSDAQRDDVGTDQKPTSSHRLELDALGVPVSRPSGVPAHLRPPPPPPPTRADKVQKGLETADDVAADIALGVVIGNVLDGPTQTLMEGLMMIEDEETPQSKKNREALKAARKEIDKQTPKREELAKKLAGYQERLDEPAGGRSPEKVEKENKRTREKMDEVRKDLAKVEGKLEKAEFDVCKFKPRVEEHERLVREKRARKLEKRAKKEADKLQTAREKHLTSATVVMQVCELSSRSSHVREMTAPTQDALVTFINAGSSASLSMSSLPAEILQRIIDHLSHPAPETDDIGNKNDLASLLQVSLTFHHIAAPVLYHNVRLAAEDFGLFAVGLDEPAPTSGNDEDKLKRKLHKAELLGLVEISHFDSELLDSYVFNHIVRIHPPLASKAKEAAQKPAKRARVDEESTKVGHAVWTRCVDVEAEYEESKEPKMRMYGESPFYIKINTLHNASGRESEEELVHLLPGCANRIYLRDRDEIEETVESHNKGWAEDICGGLSHFLHRWRDLDIPDAPETTVEFYLPPLPPPPPPEPQPEPETPAEGGKKKKKRQRKPRPRPDIAGAKIDQMVVNFCAGVCAGELDLLKEETNRLFDNISFEESDGPGCLACTADPGDIDLEPTLKLRTRQEGDPIFDPDALRDEDDLLRRQQEEDEDEDEDEEDEEVD